MTFTAFIKPAYGPNARVPGTLEDWKALVGEERLADLIALDRMSGRVRGMTPLEHPDRQAGEDFCKLVLQLVEEHGFSYQQVSMLIGKSPAHVRLKLGRRGYVPNAPSQHPYQGTLTPRPRQQGKTHCPAGHEFNAENTWFFASGRRCKLCAKAKRKDRK